MIEGGRGRDVKIRSGKVVKAKGITEGKGREIKRRIEAVRR